MSSLCDFTVGDKVFVLDGDATPVHGDSWLGVEISGADDERSTVCCKIVLTNDIPGYALGDCLDLDDNVIAVRELTVDALLDMNPMPPVPDEAVYDTPADDADDEPDEDDEDEDDD